MSEPTDDFEYERRFFCRELPDEYNDGDIPALIIQSYYVHADNYALRVRLVSHKVSVNMTLTSTRLPCWMSTASSSRRPSLPLRDRPWAAPDMKWRREVGARIAAELIKRGGEVVIKNRYSVWIARTAGVWMCLAGSMRLLSWPRPNDRDQ